MEQVLDVVFEVLFMLLITCVQTFLYTRTIGLRQGVRGLRLAAVVLCVALLEAASQIVIFDLGAVGQSGNLLILLILLYPVLFMGGGLAERIFFGVVSIVIFAFSVLLAAVALFPQSLTMLAWRESIPIFTVMLGVIAGLTLVSAHLNTEGKRYLPRWYWAGLLAGFLALFCGLLAAYGWVRQMESLHVALKILPLVALVVWLLGYVMFYTVCRYFAKSAEAEALALHNDMIERHMLQRQAAEERVKMLSHDLKHSLSGWRALAEEKGDRDALQSIAEYEGELRCTVLADVGNETANALLGQKRWQAEAAGVALEVDGLFQPGLLISRIDLCALLGNLLDNGIEAASEAQTEALRRVVLAIRRKGNLLVLRVENGYAHEPVVENGVFVTRKGDGGLHAVGKRSIRHVAEKYGGMVQDSYGEHWFKATVMLKGYEGVLSGGI